MMKKLIRNRTELRMEIARLTEQKNLQETMIKHKINTITEQMKPINLIKSAVKSFSGDGELKSQVASKGTEAIIGFIVSNLLFKNANPVIRGIASLLGSTATVKFFGEDTGHYIDKIKSLFQKIKASVTKTEKSESVSFDEKDIYQP